MTMGKSAPQSIDERLRAHHDAITTLAEGLDRERTDLDDVITSIVETLKIIGEIMEAIKVDRSAIMALYQAEWHTAPAFDALPTLPPSPAR
jgi:hypothetical protein